MKSEKIHPVKKKILKSTHPKMISELRQDIVSGDWVLIAPAREIRPLLFKHKEHKAVHVKCPFDDPQKSGNPSPVLVYQNEKGTDWFLQVIPNKYPAVMPGHCKTIREHGPYKVRDGEGFHEVVILREHDRHISQYKIKEIKRLLDAYQDRYRTLAQDKCIEYISIFHNYGREAGASVPHPHSQILALPVVPPDVSRSIRGSRDYFHEKGRCIHCDMINHELKDKERIIFENKNAVVLAPYVSRSNFETRVFPKKHEAFFENVDGTGNQLLGVSEALHEAFLRMYKHLKNPSFNFFLHTAPTMKKLDYNHYHWHFEIIPKLEFFGGFELGTGIDIITVAPEMAAKILRK